MPQSARPARTACAISGPVGQTGLTVASASSASPARASSASSRSCAPAPCGRSASRARARRDAGDVASGRADCRRDEQPLLAPREGDQHGVVQARRMLATASMLAVSSSPSSRCRWMAAAIDLAARRAAAVRLRCLPAGSRAASRSRAAPIPAADRGCRRRSAAAVPCAQCRRPGKPGGQPAVERRLREQPLAGDLGAGHGAVGHQLVELALGQPQVGAPPRRWSAAPVMQYPANSCKSIRKLTIFAQNARFCARSLCRTTSPPCNSS